MSSSSSQNEFSHRQGSITSLPDEDDQITTTSDPLPTVTEHPKVLELDDTQTATIDLQSVPDSNNDENTDQEQLSKETSINDEQYNILSQSESTDDLTTSLGFTHQQQIDPIDKFSNEINSKTDYETLVRSQKLYYDPNPELIRKPQMIKPLVYKQNITIKFLKPPPVPLGPLIIREVRPPQPPPPPPLVIRQRPPPPLSPAPLVLREKPPRVPEIMTTQVLTKTLPPIPPPPRSVIIEKLAPLPPKPRDIIIERWIPYESTTHKRKVVIERAEEVKPHPPPRNIIITYDNIEAKIVRQFQRHGVAPEDPANYSARYGNSLLDTKDLLARARELGITEDLSLPNFIDQELQEQMKSNSSERNISYENPLLEKRSSNGSYTSNKVLYNNTDNPTYAPTYENLINGSSINYDDWNENQFDQANFGEDLSTQLAQYGLTKESIPY